jgi:hypothetical protein
MILTHNAGTMEIDQIECFDLCINFWFNGQLINCRLLFAAMSKEDRKALITYIQGCYDYTHDVETFYSNLLKSYKK